MHSFNSKVVGHRDFVWLCLLIGRIFVSVDPRPETANKGMRHSNDAARSVLRRRQSSHRVFTVLTTGHGYIEAKASRYLPNLCKWERGKGFEV